ncbi:TonB-dependent receptor [Dokdonella sp.]|uniref:TonB-dependent receptor n=1 Tax=Dokdonella sp. TaxID=2291710 RepID=UPI00352943C7
MSSALRRSTLAAATSTAILFTMPVLGQENSGNEAEAREEEKAEAYLQTSRDPLMQDTPWTTDAIRVTARGTANDWPSALATDVITYENAVAAPADFQDLVTRIPGIGVTGQNGLFETFSIRGSGANGILILFGGMPLTAQRRAGIPVAFAEPILLGDINATRGPAVVHFGAGALGGAISIEPRWFNTTVVDAGYATSGNESIIAGATGSESFSIAAARHRAGDSEAPNGTPLNTGYTRESATLQFRTQLGGFDLDALLLPSRTENIGKSNIRYPTRDTTYPEDSHTLGRIRLRNDSGFEASVHAHQQYLGTYNQRPNTPDTFAAVSSTDFAGNVQQTFVTGDFTNNIGLEYLGRRDVDAYDARGNVHNRTYSLKNGEENALSLFALTDWRVASDFGFEFGARTTSIEQEQASARSSDSGTAFTAGAIWTPGRWSRFTLNVASGYRFPTLEERFYTGVTAQGEILGNPDLGTEYSLAIDLGYSLNAGNWSGEAHLWRSNVDDLIQLIEVSPDLNGYTNVGKAKLHGVEAALSWMPTDALTLRTTATYVRGTDERSGDPLYGIPPVNADIEAHYKAGNWDASLRYTHNWAFDRPGFEELERDSVNIVDADFRYYFTPNFNMQVFIRNAFDELYFATADELSTYAPERSVGINLHWSMN